VLAALEYRERTGRGQALDISMQDAAAWLTHLSWTPGLAGGDAGTMIECSDGYVFAGATASNVAAALGSDIGIAAEIVAARGRPREDITALLAQRGIAGAPVRSVSEVIEHPQTVARNFIVKGRSVVGKEWPLMACPLRLTATPPAVKRAIGAIGADAAEIAADWKKTAGQAQYEKSA
jgi:crotonobetainyl-CoA:carnitine CoA-transferase CaiB-like acyl-CoA transferase